MTWRFLITRRLPCIHVIIQCPVGKDCLVKIDLCNIVNCVLTPWRQGRDWQYPSKYVCVTPCNSWHQVFANTGLDWRYNPAVASNLKPCFTIVGRLTSEGCLPGICAPLFIIIKNVIKSDEGNYVLGARVSGSDPLGHFDFLTDNPFPIFPTNGWSG